MSLSAFEPPAIMLWFYPIVKDAQFSASEHGTLAAAPVRRITGRRFMMVKRALDGGFSLEPVLLPPSAGAWSCHTALEVALTVCPRRRGHECLRGSLVCLL